MEMNLLTLPKMTKAERNTLGVESAAQINRTFDDTRANPINYLMPSAIHAKQTYNTQTLSS